MIPVEIKSLYELAKIQAKEVADAIIKGEPRHTATVKVDAMIGTLMLLMVAILFFITVNKLISVVQNISIA